MLSLVMKLCVLEFFPYAVQNFYIQNVAHRTDRQRYVKCTSPVLHKEKQSPQVAAEENGGESSLFFVCFEVGYRVAIDTTPLS